MNFLHALRLPAAFLEFPKRALCCAACQLLDERRLFSQWITAAIAQISRDGRGALPWNQAVCVDLR